MAHEGARFAFAASARNGPFTSALRQPVAGTVYYVMLAVFAVMPLLVR